MLLASSGSIPLDWRVAASMGWIPRVSGVNKFGGALVDAT